MRPPPGQFKADLSWIKSGLSWTWPAPPKAKVRP